MFIYLFRSLIETSSPDPTPDPRKTNGGRANFISFMSDCESSDHGTREQARSQDPIVPGRRKIPGRTMATTSGSRNPETQRHLAKMILVTDLPFKN
jgi:hypothetical protein